MIYYDVVLIETAGPGRQLPDDLGLGRVAAGELESPLTYG